MDSFGPFNSLAKTTWLFVDRRSGNGLVKKFTSPAMFCLHTVNFRTVVRSHEGEEVDRSCELIEFRIWMSCTEFVLRTWCQMSLKWKHSNKRPRKRRPDVGTIQALWYTIFMVEFQTRLWDCGDAFEHNIT